MGLFKLKIKPHLQNIEGYIIDTRTGMLVDVPKGLSLYKIPKEVKQLNPELNLKKNKALLHMSTAHEIVFEEGSIREVPDEYFTFGNAFSNLKKVMLPEDIIKLGNNCIDITTTEYNFPSSLTHLGTNMYPVVQSLVIENTIQKLGSMFAANDTNLIYVEVAGSIKELPTGFINRCKNVKTLILHEGVEKDNLYSFGGLNSLEYVELPDSFTSSFQTFMEEKETSNKRGNSCYKPENGLFETQKNNMLTIKKIHKKIPYIFQVRREDFKEITFQGSCAEIRSTLGNRIHIDLEKLSQGTICQVDIDKDTIQQIPMLKNQFSALKTNPDIDFTEEQLSEQFEKIYKENIMTSELFQVLNNNTEKSIVKQTLYDYFNKKVRLTKKLSIPCNDLDVVLSNIVTNMKKQILQNQFMVEGQDLEQEKRMTMKI
ncbi:MAG: leucine-rich repeat protein [Bacilli bacterium]|nr:leucine-rich repeat protein [Bacilli bacterium]